MDLGPVAGHEPGHHIGRELEDLLALLVAALPVAAVGLRQRDGGAQSIVGKADVARRLVRVVAVLDLDGAGYATAVFVAEEGVETHFGYV